MSEDRSRCAPTDPVSAGVRDRCPRCGQGKLFDGFLALRERCANCGRDCGFTTEGRR